jgi:uncharacterized LabA/DUF88 family protein
MTIRACVFVDGENFRHSILDIFGHEFHEAEYLPRTANWEAFFDHVVTKSKHTQEVVRLRTYWYVTQYIDFVPYHLPDPDYNATDFVAIVKRNKTTAREIDATPSAEQPTKLKEIFLRLQARERSLQKRFQVWTDLQNGITSKHSAIEFRRAGAITYNLHHQRFGQEKCVDVKLALDLLILKDIYDYAIIVSGDQDYVPAVQTIKDHGKRVINVSFRTRSGELLPGGARRLNHVTDDNIVIPYDELKSFLNITPAAAPPANVSATTLTPPPTRPPPPPALDATVTPIVEQILAALAPATLQTLITSFERSNQIPPELDGKLLARSRAALARDLDSTEKSRARALFRHTVRAKATPALPGTPP